MDKIDGVWKAMNWTLKKYFSVMLVVLLFCGLCCACGETEKSDKELATQAVEAFLESIKEHDVKRTNELLCGDEFIDPDDEELIRAVFYTIEDCYLESIDFPDTDNLDYFVATVHYVIVYSDDYIPVGSRTQGKNEIVDRFTLEKRDGQYVILSIVPRDALNRSNVNEKIAFLVSHI